FTGCVETTTDALRLILAARQGIVPRITRRLNDSERRSMIRSGAIFVFSVEESGIKRWTEGLAWSPSRIVGNFLVYREVTERGSRGNPDRHVNTPGTSSFQANPSHSSQRRREGGSAQTITVKVDGTDHHLIAYYREDDVRSGRLQRPTTRPDIMALTIPPEMVRGTNFRHPPHVE
ncbi:Gti1/Pac2 family-domain-containing protein, partial [Vararia minispora EC-137]